jgi:hypothetical protein
MVNFCLDRRQGLKTYCICRTYRAVLSNKFLFWHHLHRHVAFPPVYAQILHGELVPTSRSVWDEVWNGDRMQECFVKPAFGPHGGAA